MKRRYFVRLIVAYKKRIDVALQEDNYLSVLNVVIDDIVYKVKQGKLTQWEVEKILDKLKKYRLECLGESLDLSENEIFSRKLYEFTGSPDNDIFEDLGDTVPYLGDRGDGGDEDSVGYEISFDSNDSLVDKVAALKDTKNE